MVDYSKRKSAKWGFTCTGSRLDLKMGYFDRGDIQFKDKVLTDYV